MFPAAQIVPYEVAFDQEHIFCFLHNSIINRNTADLLVHFLQNTLIVGSIDAFLNFHQTFVQFWQMFFDCLKKNRSAKNKNTAVPKKISALKKTLRSCEIGFLGKRLHTISLDIAIRSGLLINLDIPVTYSRTIWRNSDGDKAFFLFCQFMSCFNCFLKTGGSSNEVVRR